MPFQFNPAPPQTGEYTEYFGQYIQLACEEPDIAVALERQIADLRTLVESADPGELAKPHDPYLSLIHI